MRLGEASLSAIELRGVAKHWGTTRAVDGINLTAPQGSLVVLLGPSGCGKSTLLRLIAGLEETTEGTIRIGGEDVTRLPPARRHLAMVFQNYALFPHLDVRENILFGLKVRKVGAADRERRLKRVAELLAIGHLLERKPGQLSGGQQQRVALGRAIIAEQPVCLMDEPLSNLDAQLRQDMRREIRGLQRELGVTMIYVTHDQTEAMSMADQVVLLRDGRVEQDATPAELYARPATLFVAAFIGTPPMNRLALADGPHGACIKGDHEAVIGAGGGTGLVLGVRPEDMVLAVDGAEGLGATVESSEYFGADTIVACRIGTETALIRCAGNRLMPPGTAVRLGWTDGAAHLFDAGTGRRRDDD